MNIKAGLSLTIMLLSSFWIPVAAQQALRPLPESKNTFMVIAHRGSHLIKPENTIAAIEDAIAIGADYVELDLRTTKDGQLVLLHNEGVNQVSNGKGLIKELDFEDVKKLVLKGKDGSLHQIAGFDEALKACKNKINIYLDFKAAEPEKAYSAIKRENMEHQVLVYVGNSNDYTSWRKTAPKMPLIGSLAPSVTTKETLMEVFAKTPLEVIDRVPAEDLLPLLKGMGISIFPDVQNATESPENWDKAIKPGVQGLQTDHPEALIKYLKAKKIRPN